ncbi:hypothetical protein M9435_004847 [Picochlorum sp. BPE23]|nr:hypothetical protein M9435_004847 [Picochlorum sp. BPE23]
MDMDDEDFEDFDEEFFSTIDKVVEQYKARKDASQHQGTLSPSQGSPRHTTVESAGHGVPQTGVEKTEALKVQMEQPGGSQGGLQWNAVSKFSRIAAQRKAGVGSLDTGSVQGRRMDGTINAAVVATTTGNGIQHHQTVNAPVLESGHAEQRDAIMMPQQAQLSELQRQVNNYKRQLMFKQQEIDELRRQSSKATNMQIDDRGVSRMHIDPSKAAAGVPDVEGNALQARGVARKVVNSPSSGVRDDSPLVLEQPTTPTFEKSNSVEDASTPCIVPVMMAPHTGSQLSLTERLAGHGKDVDCIKEYKLARERFGMQLDDVQITVLGNLERELGNNRPNLNDVSILLLSTMVHVVHTDAKSVVGNYITREEDIESFLKFVDALFSILNEFVVDGGIRDKLEEFAQESGDPNEMIQSTKKSITTAIVHLLKILFPMNTTLAYHALEKITQFLLLNTSMHSDMLTSMFVPVLQSKSFQMILMKFPALRNKLIQIILNMVESKDVLSSMECSASLELNVSPSKQLANNQYRTPSRLRPRAHRRHSIVQKKLENADIEFRESAWSHRLVQSVCLCLADESQHCWDTIRLCLSFFASLLERHADAILRSVIEESHFHNLDVTDLVGEEHPSTIVAKSLPLQLIDAANRASGSLGTEPGMHMMLIEPALPDGFDYAEQKSHLKRLRVVQECLTLLRGFMTHPIFEGLATESLLSDTHTVLCTLEKMTRYQNISRTAQKQLFVGYPLSPWVQSIGSSSVKSSFCPSDVVTRRGGFDSYPSVDDVVYISRGLKSRLLTKLADG